MKNLRKTIQCSSRSNEKNIYIFEKLLLRLTSNVISIYIYNIEIENELIKKLNIIFYNKN